MILFKRKAKSIPLSASIINREAIRILRNELIRPTRSDGRIEPYPLQVRGRRGTYSEAIGAIGPNDRDLSLETFAGYFIAPAMRRLAKKVCGIPLGGELMELPKGGYEAAADAFDGLALRTVISETWPVKKDSGPWTRLAQYYDISTDRLKRGKCTIGIVFTVHEPGIGIKIPVLSAATIKN